MISVVIPVFNGEAYVGQAIESVLNQSLPAEEVLVVDDGSTDGTREVIERYAPAAIYVQQQNQGPGAARNHGIRRSKGEYIAFLDADDLWMSEKLRLQRAALDADPSLDLVFGHMTQFRSPELSPERAAELVCDETPQPAPLLSCLLARRNVFDRVGPLRTDLKAEFVDWYLRAQEAGLRMLTLDTVVAKRRIHTSNFTLKHKDVRREYLQSLKASLDRRRGKAS